MSGFDELKEKINTPFKPKKGSEISQAVLFDQKMQHSLDQIIYLRQFLVKALNHYQLQIPKTQNNLDQCEEKLPAQIYGSLKSLVAHPQYRLFEVLGRINPLLKFHVIDDVKHANLVMECAKDLPILKKFIFEITPEINTSETDASSHH